MQSTTPGSLVAANAAAAGSLFFISSGLLNTRTAVPRLRSHRDKQDGFRAQQEVGSPACDGQQNYFLQCRKDSQKAAVRVDFADFPLFQSFIQGGSLART